MWRYDTNDPASPFHSKIWKWDPKSVTGSLLWEGCAGLWVRSLPGSVGFTNCTGQRHQFSAYPDRERSLACVCLTHLTAQASGYHGGPTDILRWPSSRYPPRPRSTWSAGRGSDGPWTISLTNLTVLPRPLANTMKGPYVPGRRVEALAFTLNVTVTPLVSVTPWVELAVSQDGVLIE